MAVAIVGDETLEFFSEHSRLFHYALVGTGIVLQILALFLDTKTGLDFAIISISIVVVTLGFWFPAVSGVLICLWFIAAVMSPVPVQQGSGLYLSLVAVGYLITRRPFYLGIILDVISSFAVYYGHSSIVAVSGKFGMILYLLPLLVGFGYNQLRLQKEAQESEERLKIAALREDLANQLHDKLSANLVQVSLLSRLLEEAEGDNDGSVVDKIREVSSSALVLLREFTADLGQKSIPGNIEDRNNDDTDEIAKPQS